MVQVEKVRNQNLRLDVEVKDTLNCFDRGRDAVARTTVRAGEE